MRKAFLSVIMAFAAVLSPFSLSAQDGRLFMPKGDFSAGAQFASMSIDSNDSDFMLLLNPLTASGSVSMVAPFCEFSYRDNRSVGLRLHYMKGIAQLDDLHVDLLNDGMSFDIPGFGGRMNSFGVSFYHRNYFGLDEKGRLGVILEESLSYTGGRTFSDADSSDASGRSSRIKASFSPGLVLFVMNNVSVMLTVSMANISYSTSESGSGGNDAGSREKFSAKFGLDLLGTGFGVAFHF